jgi:hypothetical protein
MTKLKTFGMNCLYMAAAMYTWVAGPIHIAWTKLRQRRETGR